MQTDTTTTTETNWRLEPSTLSLYAEKLIIRMILRHDGLKSTFRPNYWDEDVALPLGLPEELQGEPDMQQIVRTLLEARWQEIRHKEEDETSFFTQAEKNIAFIAARLSFNETEIALFRLAVYLHDEKALRELCNNYNMRDFHRCYHFMADILDLPPKNVFHALKNKAKLYKYELIEERSRGCFNIRNYLEWGDALEFEQFMHEPLTEQSWLNTCANSSTPPSLQWDDFSHITFLRDSALRYLQHMRDSGQPGANILLYGKPGTGKSEFAALLAEKAAVHPYTVLSQDEDGDCIDGEARLVKFRVAQTLLAAQRSLLIFDEVEDVFASSAFQRSVAGSHKAWINDFLSNNPVPTIWISNDVSCMDRAAISRFDLVIEMPDLPREKKAHLLETASAGRLSADYIQHFSRQPQLLPAVIERGLKVASIVCDDNSDFGGQTLHIFNQTLQAQQHKTIGKLPAAKAAYSLQWVNCDSDLAAISAGLIARPQGRICCYGAPGTGKSAWAQWIAEQAGLPVSLCKGSDLLDKYVGGTEENIAAAFRRADTLGEALIIDEADSFLFARQGAERSWERSMVNEMLTQIEQFDGLLVITTNLMDELDPAVLRRFDLKLKFDWLTAGQAAALAAEHLSLLHLPPLDAAQQTRLQQFTSLAPGDFAAIARRHRFAPFVNAAEWLQTLMEECQLKAPHLQKRRIGF